MPDTFLTIGSGLAPHQVLQRLGKKGASLVLRGTAADGPLRVTIFQGPGALRGWSKKSVGPARRGKFEIKLTGLPIGGPYRLRLEGGGSALEVEPFFVGDVWVLAGQSNMEGVGNLPGAKPHPLVRAFSMRRIWRLAEEPLHILSESPDVCHAATQCTPERAEQLRKTATKGGGVGLHFAREMVERSGGVPQGLICAAHGGTSMAQWDPAQKKLGGQSLYGSMLASVGATGQPVAGLLWYQGESDASPADAAQYTVRMKALVAATRRDFRLPHLPWIIVQLGRVFSPFSQAKGWNAIQEEQRLLPGKINFLETVPAVDLPLDDGIHIGREGFPRLAKRLASVADRLVLGRSRELPLPAFDRVYVHETPSYCVEVRFKSIVGPLKAVGEPTGFRLVSPEGTPLEYFYRTELAGDLVRLHSSDHPASGTQLHHGQGLVPVCNIFDARGFPLPVFGPVPLDGQGAKALLPFVTQWEVSELLPAGQKLARIDLVSVKALPVTVKNFGADGFINEHVLWENKTGLAFFHARLHLAEAMKLEFLMGYDGPFRVWLNEKPFFADLAGTNPCLPDQFAKTVSLPAGSHHVHVGMDLNQGLAWGFHLRFARRDVTRLQILSGDYSRPTYLA